MTDTPAGWYPDPQVAGRQRYWDGTAWTDHTADGYVAPARGDAPGSGLPDVGRFLNLCFHAGFESFKVVLVPLVGFTVAVIVLGYAFVRLSGFGEWLVDVTEIVQDTPAGRELVLPELPSIGPAAVALAVTLVVLCLLGPVLLTVASIPPMRDALRGERPRLRSWGEVTAAAGRSFLLGLVVVGFALGAMVVVGIVLALVPVLGVLVVPALVVGGLYVFVRLSLALPMVVLDGRGVDALPASWRDTDGHGWGILGRVLLFGLVVGVASWIVGFPLQVVVSGAPSTLTFALVVSFAFQMALLPFTCVQYAVLHHALVGHRGGR